MKGGHRVPPNKLLQIPWVPVWSDLRTTHLLLVVGHRPDESIEILMTGWPQIEVGYCCLYHSGVGFGPTLLMGLKGQLLCDILP